MSSSVIWNYNALLEEGIKLIEEFSSRVWTDYNAHDPGITTLEFLCYALTDLANRVGQPLESHLAEKIEERVRLRNDFPEAPEILSCGAVTINDYRKLLIDLPGIRNAWLYVVRGRHPAMYKVVDEDRLSFAGKPEDQLQVRGLYDVVVEFDKTVAENQKAQLLSQLRRTLLANRNLCEDFVRIGEIGLEEVSVCIDVELALDSRVDEVKAEMLYVIDEFIAPGLRQYTLQEMLDKDYRIEAVLNGPLTAHGFVEDKDLGTSLNRGELHGSDLVQLLMDIPQIIAVRRLLFTTCQDGEVVALDESAVVPLAEDRVTRFSPEQSKFRFIKAGIPYVSSPAGVEQYLAQIRTRHQQAPIEAADLRPTLPDPRYREAGHYTSIQHHYPRNYMIGPEGVLPTASIARKAAVNQFKAYLLFFEQFLADFNAQIRHTANLLSPLPVSRSYAHALPEDVPRFSDLIHNQAAVAGYHEDADRFHQRRNRFLDHLLARFAEQYREYSMLVENAYDDQAPALLIGDKERLLNNFAILSSSRFQAYDYSGRDENRTISGLERRLRILLGLTSDIDLSVFQERYVEIYEEQDEDAVAEYRFRIIDDAGKILLSSTRRMLSREEARAEMRTALSAGTQEANFDISQAVDGTWHCTLHDKTGDMVGRRIEYFDSQEACRAARDNCAAFLNGLVSQDDLFVLEHMLLRPCFFDQATDAEAWAAENDRRYLLPTCFDEDDSDCCAGDAYSFRITVIMPAWPKRFQDMNFRNFLARFIREQAPAHIFVKVCWISSEQVDAFKPVYEAWKQAFAVRDELQPSVYLDALERLIGVWKGLRSVYPPVYLYDCIESKDITPTVLGDSALGHPQGADNDQD